MDDLQKTRQLFEEVNRLALGTELEHLTEEDINTEIKAYRFEKKLSNNSLSHNALLTNTPMT